MVVRTDTEQVQTVQEANLAFILLNHPLDCPICDKGGECPLQDQTMRFGPGISQLIEPKRLAKKHYDISDTIVLDQERCVLLLALHPLSGGVGGQAATGSVRAGQRYDR